MVDIQLLVTDDANRRALASVVEKQYTAITELELQRADLYLVDDASLPQYRDALDAHKREEDPVFCPVVLIRRDRTSVRIQLPEPVSDDGPLLVNEEVTAPVEEQVLFRRVANLLVRRQQTADLQKTNERLERFARTLRHELRNPLNILGGYLNIAREQGNEDAFDRCQRAVGQMERLLEDTLAVLQGGAPAIKQEPVDLEPLCRQCWEIVSDSDARLEITTTKRIAADRDRLTQVLENLFRNAIEHTDADVTVTVGALEEGFYVEDDGSGIPEGERGMVFEEGYTTRGSGSGLGLAVVKTVAEAHGWEVRVTGGTTGGGRFEFLGVDATHQADADDWVSG